MAAPRSSACVSTARLEQRSRMRSPRPCAQLVVRLVWACSFPSKGELRGLPTRAACSSYFRAEVSSSRKEPRCPRYQSMLI